MPFFALVDFQRDKGGIMQRPNRITTVTFLVVAFALVLGRVRSAEAHQPNIVASTSCLNRDGSWTVCFTSTAWLVENVTFRENDRIEIYFVYEDGTTDLVDVGAYNADNAYSFSGCATVPANRTSVWVRAYAAVPWGDGDGLGAARETFVTAPTGACESEHACWLTAGGPKFSHELGCPAGENGPRHSWGGNVYPGCSSTAGDGGSWNHLAHSAKLHFHATHIEVIRCGNVPGIEPGSESPVTPSNFIDFEGHGWLKGVKGNKDSYDRVYFFAHCEDRNEPGSNGAKDGDDVDRYFIHVFADPSDPVNSSLLLLDVDGDPTTVDPVTITGGNMQIHSSSCDSPPPSSFGAFRK
jgi:hypothetical protein